jgi:hypothetical protein
MCCVSAAEMKEDSSHSGMLNLASVEEQSSLHSEGSFEVTWDWPQEPFELSQEAETEQQLLQDVGLHWRLLEVSRFAYFHLLLH